MMRCYRKGIIYSPPNLPGWDTIPLKKLLQERFGMTCHVEHDGNAGALAEWYFGAARGARNVVFLTMGTGIARLAAMRFPNRWKEDQVTVRELAQLAGSDDARRVFDEAGRYLGRGLAILLDILNPEAIVIGSLAVRLGELLPAPARTEMQREALPGAVKACRVVPAELGERIGDVTALCAAISALGGPVPASGRRS